MSTRQKDSTSNTIYLLIRSLVSSPVGRGLTGLTFATAGLVMGYVRDLGAGTDITLVTQTVTGAWVSGGFVEVDSVKRPGLYRLDVPNAAFVSGVNTFRLYWTGANSLDDGAEVDLPSYDAYAAPNSTSQIASAVWDELRVSHVTAGSFGQGIASVQGSITGSVATVTDKAAYALSATGLDAVLDSANGVETGFSIRGMWRALAAVLLGKASGLDTATAIYRNAVADTKARVTATTTIDGNRTVITIDQT